MLQGKIPIQFAFQEEEEEFKDCASLTNNQNELFYEKLTVIPQSGSYIHGRSIDGRPIYFSKKLRMNFRPSEQYRPHLKSLYQTVQSIERNTLRRKSKSHSNSTMAETLLWTEKYRPKRFTDLLSVDEVNLEVLKWANQWKDGGRNADSKKILLLGGPPGLGKTTLAETVARTGGWHLLHINASDERTGDAVKQRILAALTSNTMQRQPSLILIDEIDGALDSPSDRSFLRWLANLANNNNNGNPRTLAKKKEEESEEQLEGGGGGEEETNLPVSESLKSKGGISRPIICICNDLYAPALRGLRQVAQIVTMRPPSAAALSARLKAICDAEGLSIDLRNLMDLCDYTLCDVRASLHALQFISRNDRLVCGAGKLVEKLAGGFKDGIQRSNMAIWQSIFSIRGSHQKSSLESLLATFDDCDGHELERLLTGCFEIFPQVKVFDDAKLSRLGETLEWFGWADQLHAAGYHKGGGSFGLAETYLPWALLKIHHQIKTSKTGSSNSWKYPRVDYERFMESQQSQSILASTLKGNSTIGRWEWRLERLPAFLEIVRAGRLRVSNPQLMREEDLSLLARIVQCMSAEAIGYKQVRSAVNPGEYTIQFEPPIDRLMTIGGGEVTTLGNHELAIRQVILSELEKARLLQKTTRLAISSPPSVVAPLPKKPLKRDFFGRPILEEATPRPAEATSSKDNKNAVWFKYHEGYSNAVRKTIRVSAFLQK